MALALGLGSLFNHAPSANVSFALDRREQCIRYRTVKDIAADEELCICYGAGRMWWEDGISETQSETSEGDECALFGRLDPTAPILKAPVDFAYDAPLWRITSAPDPRTMPMETCTAWAMNVEPRVCSSVARRLQSLAKDHQLACSEGPFALRHLRTFRKAAQVTPLDTDANLPAVHTPTDALAVLVARQEAHSPTALKMLLIEALGDLTDVHLYPVCVPVIAAPSRARLHEWSAVWPCMFLPPGAGIPTRGAIPGSDAARAASLVDRTADAGMWKLDAVECVRNAFERCLETARMARKKGQVPVAAFVTSDPLGGGEEHIEADAYDTRIAERHPLRHAVPNVVRAVADVRATQRNATNAANGQDYLLSNLALFITHEPCVYCAMALVHSRVRSVYFLFPSPGAGGFCGAHAGQHGLSACIAD
ncbi:hypothetical protein MVES_001739 [Malassezia vespertilionis]|uniref:CMP/dCMP-type deaminase domain-containing protein n=1 Tax=Malassezia vespertilionis TaxID=2020962 RepID=A0A2N1JCF4_9BASI|nr:hypothetical protein MVES_001739 [Malassezia vespertilionis]